MLPLSLPQEDPTNARRSVENECCMICVHHTYRSNRARWKAHLCFLLAHSKHVVEPKKWPEVIECWVWGFIPSIVNHRDSYGRSRCLGTGGKGRTIFVSTLLLKCLPLLLSREGFSSPVVRRPWSWNLWSHESCVIYLLWA